MKEVLICVDDEPHILRAMVRILKNESFEVKTTTNIDEAIAWTKVLPVRAFISDYRMEQMTGLVLLQKIKEIKPDVGRLILSGYSEKSLIDMALTHGDVHEFILKPFDTEKFKFFLRRFFKDSKEWEEV